MSRHCDAIGCNASVAPGRFMCLRHWRLVPLDTQTTINKQYHAGRKDFAFLSDPIYLQACIDAIDGIAAAACITGTNPYRRLLWLAQRKAKTSGATT